MTEMYDYQLKPHIETQGNHTFGKVATTEEAKTAQSKPIIKTEQKMKEKITTRMKEENDWKMLRVKKATTTLFLN